jgi:hypothetical protein
MRRDGRNQEQFGNQQHCNRSRRPEHATRTPTLRGGDQHKQEKQEESGLGFAHQQSHAGGAENIQEMKREPSRVWPRSMLSK